MTDWSNRKGPWIETRSGERWYFQDCRPEDVVLSDIAYALAHTNRFNGHAPHNVAVHSLRVADIVVALGSPEHELSALTHDAHEAYVGDMVSPLKLILPGFAEIEELSARAVRTALGVPVELPSVVESADLLALEEEAFAYFVTPAHWNLPTPAHRLAHRDAMPPGTIGKDLVEKILDRERPEARVRREREPSRTIALYWYERYLSVAARMGLPAVRSVEIRGRW